MKKTHKFLLSISFLSLITSVPAFVISCAKEDNKQDESKNSTDNTNNNKNSEINKGENTNKNETPSEGSLLNIDFSKIFNNMNIRWKHPENTYFEDATSNLSVFDFEFNENEMVQVIISKVEKTENEISVDFKLVKNNQSKTFNKKFARGLFKKHTETPALTPEIKSKEQEQFEDLKDFPKNFEIKMLKNTKPLSPTDLYFQCKDMPSNIFVYINIGAKLFNQYDIKAEFKNGTTRINKITNTIENVVIIFSKNNQSIEKKINILPYSSHDVKNDDSPVLMLELPKHIKAMYPSFLGSILISNDDYHKDNTNNKTYDWEYFITGNNNELFNNNINIKFAILKNYFFKVKESLKEKIGFKVEKVKADDLEGTLEIQLKIENIDETDAKFKTYTQQSFKFKDLRKFEFKNKTPEIFNFYFLQNELKDILSKYKINKDSIDTLKNTLKNVNETDITTHFNNKLNALKNSLYAKLRLWIKDTENTYELKASNDFVTSFIAKNNNTSIYPLVLNITPNIIKNLKLKLIKTQNNKYDLSVIITISIFPYTSSNLNTLSEQGTNANEVTWDFATNIKLD